MNRQKNLLVVTAVLVVVSVAYWVWSGWGLVTVEVSDKPLSQVIRSIEKQAGIVLKTNMDTSKPVTMHVHKVPLTEALETLAEVTDSRWRVGYFFGPDGGAVKNVIETISSGKRPEGWKNFDVPLFARPGGDDDAVRIDPRYDVWNVKDPEEKTLQGFLKGASAGVGASFSCPEEFNPAVTKAPSSGEIRKAAPQLAKIAGAKYEEVFLLMGRPAGVAEGDRDRREEDGPGGPRRFSGGDRGRAPDFSQIRARQLAEIEKLPKSEQAAAKAEFEEREKFFTSMRELTDDERRQKMEEFFNKPENQAKMDDRRIRSDERKTPQQRLERYSKYVQRKQQAAQAKAQ